MLRQTRQKEAVWKVQVPSGNLGGYIEWSDFTKIPWHCGLHQASGMIVTHFVFVNFDLLYEILMVCMTLQNDQNNVPRFFRCIICLNFYVLLFQYKFSKLICHTLASHMVRYPNLANKIKYNLWAKFRLTTVT